jgi:hypothetical protein
MGVIRKNAAKNLCPAGTFDISPVIYLWVLDEQPNSELLG